MSEGYFSHTLMHKLRGDASKSEIISNLIN